jgi:CheY-like chemotaxis protein
MVRLAPELLTWQSLAPDMSQIQARLTVLLAEDDPNDVVLIKRALEKLNRVARVIPVCEGEEVIPYLRGTDRYADRHCFPAPDVLVLDRRMGGLSGLDVLVWLRGEPSFRTLPVLLLSNTFSPQEIAGVERLNASHVLKTLDFGDLPQVLNNGLELALQRASPDRPDSPTKALDPVARRSCAPSP